MKHAALLFAVVALAACSKQSEAPGKSAGVAADTAIPTVTEVNAQPVTAADGPLRLTPLATGAASSLGKTGLECGFEYQGRSLLVTTGTSANSGSGVAVVDGEQLDLAAARGDFASHDDVTLSGSGYTFALKRLDGDRQVVNGRTQWPARLVVTGPDGQSEFSPGTWNCTP